METWIPLLSEYGFPIVVTLYLLHRVEKKLDLVNESVQELPGKITQQMYRHSHEQKKSFI
ncbi:YvrJ family protein [Anaerobacillus sp. MEB173]|uniref:YvrJ family protein n=1 Tax=Anaerobacillus sp. MEB173 TaxID=3383345 RepID=UPI003F92738D